MKYDTFKYIFRFCCDPGFNDEQEILALLCFAKQAAVDDVAVFANVEEINTGHMTFEEQNVYLRMMRRIKSLLEKGNITMSINQWHSVMHADIGKKLRPDQPFRLMVDGNGKQAELCVCPLCTDWQEYIGRLYARYAELEPSILWVEDDFRLHNHEPLAWGGCFCDEHMRLYSERAGKKLTRQEFLSGVLHSGKPHPYRKIWLDTARETMLSAARAINRSVRSVNTTSRIGLMSSAPHVHAAEGRNWPLLLDTLTKGAPPVDRIHLPGYQELTPSGYLQGFNMVSMLTRAMLAPETQVYPELENFPFSLFSKSRRFTRFQLLCALALAPDGITLDLFDLNGNGIVWEDHYQEMLRQTKPFLNHMTQSGVFRGGKLGVRVLYHQDSAYTLHTKQGVSMEELYPHDSFFAGLLPAMGIPFVFCDRLGFTGQIAAVSGQVLRNWNRQEISQLFENNFVILNGDALETLCDMGLGTLAGVESVCWMKQNEGEYCFEQVTNGKTYCGRKNARASAVISCADALDVSYLSAAQCTEYTALYDSFRQRRASGQVVVNGKVLIYPFGNFASPTDIPPMLLNRLRQEILCDIFVKANAPFPIVQDVPYLEPYCFQNEGSTDVYLVNGSMDDVKQIRMHLPQICGKAEIIQSNWEESGSKPLSFTVQRGEAVLDAEIPSMESALMRFSCAGK